MVGQEINLGMLCALKPMYFHLTCYFGTKMWSAVDGRPRLTAASSIFFVLKSEFCIYPATKYCVVNAGKNTVLNNKNATWEGYLFSSAHEQQCNS